ncbi:MAG: phosphoribosylglycinamide formyltransferase [Elusimicrobiota bacterium]
MTNIAVFVSGSGSNLQALIDSCNSGFVPGEIKLVLSSKKNAYALVRAKKAGIESLCLRPADFSGEQEYSEEILRRVKKRNIDIICLAGFLSKLGNNIVNEYRNRILNIHPALLPKFGGKGMYGMRVHREVIKAGEKISGCTVHFVDENYDTGPVIMQKKVPVKKGEKAEELAARVLEEEHRLYPKALKKVIEEKSKKER